MSDEHTSKHHDETAPAEPSQPIPPAPTPAPAGPVELPEGCTLTYVVQADKKVLPTDSIVVSVSAPASLELVPDVPPAPGTAASGTLIATDVPATGVTVNAMLTHAGGQVLKASATVDVVLPDPATKITIGLGKPLRPRDPNVPVKGSPRNPNF